MDKHWIVKAPDSLGEPSGKPNRQFVSERQAMAVAERLALDNPGQRFVVYEAKAVIKTGGVQRDYL